MANDVININANRAPVVYSVTIAHYYDGKLEFKIEDVADDDRSREAVINAFRRISGADQEIEKLTNDLKQAVWSDSKYCAALQDTLEKQAKRISELEAENAKLRQALRPFATVKERDIELWYGLDPDPFVPDDAAIMTIDGSPTVGDIRHARAALGENDE